MAERLPRIYGDYALLERLGQGAAGDVYLARPLSTRSDFPTPIVIKRLHEKHAKDEEFIRRFRHEAQIAVCVDSPHVAKVYAAGSYDGSLYIAMEYVPGLPVSRFLSLMVTTKRYLPLVIAAELIAGALSGLRAIHDATDEAGRPLGFVHRDVSPKNLMVGDDGYVRLIDLGFGKSNVQDWKTGTGIVLGSVGYMAPEQIQARPLDHRADIYAMGIVLFELLTLRRYIKPDALPAMVAASLSQPFTPPSQFRTDVPAALDQITRRAVSPDPRDRFQSADDFLTALRAAVPDRCPPAQVAGYLMSALESELRMRRRDVERLLAQPLPVALEDAEKTRVDIYAQRVTHGEISAKTDAGFGGPLSALERVFSSAEQTQATDPRLDDIHSAMTRAATLLDVRTISDPEQSETEIKTDRTLKLPARSTPNTTTPVRMSPAPAPGTVVSGTFIHGRPMGDLQVAWSETPHASLFVGPRLWIVIALVIMAMTAGIAGGMLIASTHEQRLVVQGQEPPPPPPAAPSLTPPSPPAASTAPLVAPAAQPEPVPQADEARDPSPASRKKKSPVSKDSAHPISNDAPQAEPELDVAAKAKALEDRAVQLKSALAADESKAARLQKVLLDLSFVRASKNSARAAEQLRTIERALAELESR